MFVKFLHNIYTGNIQTCCFQTSIKIREQILENIKADYSHSSVLVSVFSYKTPFSGAEFSNKDLLLVLKLYQLQ